MMPYAKKYSACATAIAASLALLCCMPAYAAAEDDYPVDSRIKLLRYDVNDVYTIYTLYGYQTNIEFAKNEEIQTISVGDRSLWQIIPSGYRIFIRPMDDDVSTNMTVITNVRTYQFDLKSGKGTLANNPHMVYVARFTYPDKKKSQFFAPTSATSTVQPVTLYAPPEAAVRPLMTPPPAAPLTSITPVPAIPTLDKTLDPALPRNSDLQQPLALNMNHLYTYTGPDALAPMQVYDDGRATFLRFADMTSRLPQIQAIDKNGRLQPVTYALKNGFMVVDTVAPRMVITYAAGKENTIYLYNEAMQGGGGM